MIYPSRLQAYFLYGVTMWCLVSFKIVLTGVSGGDGGIRIDDLLILMAAFVLLMRGEFRRIKVSRPLRLYLICTATGIVSACWNGIVTGRVPFFYSLISAVRIVEYIIFYYLGYFIARTGFNLARFLTAYLWTLLIVIPLQMVSIIPIASGFSPERAIGNTNGPYELAAVASFTLCYLGYSKQKKIAGSLSLLYIFLSASRVTAVAALISLAKVGITRAKTKRGIVTVVTGGAATVILFLSLSYVANHSQVAALGLLNRLDNSESITSWSQVVTLYNDAPLYETASDYANGAYAETDDFSYFGGDESGFMRFKHWIILIKNTVNHPDSLIIGLGPSFGTIAVDGYFVRVFIETGFLGLLTFCASIGFMLFDKRRSTWAFREFVLIMLLTGIFIDIFSSYHPMILLWLWHGMNEFEARSKLSSKTPRSAVYLPRPQAVAA